MKNCSSIIAYLVILLICLPACGSSSISTKVQASRIQSTTAHTRTKQEALKINEKGRKGKANFVSNDLSQEGQNPSSKQSTTGQREKQTIPKPLSITKRGITVFAKATGGKSQSIQLYDYTVALVIGIDQYENLGASEMLSYAVKDAKGVEKVLRNSFKFDEIITLYNEQATRNTIMKTLYGFRSLSPNAGVLIYFACHGVTIPNTVDGKDLGYLVPYDGSLNSSDMYKNISMQQIKSDICVSISAKHVFFVFDACFAGLMLDTRGNLIRPSRDFSYLKAITNEQVRQVLTAGSKDQTVLDNGPGGHSVFTGRFIEALANTEDYITARELGQYLKQKVYGDAAARGHTQRPVDGEIYGTGDFVFVPDFEKKGREIGVEINALETEIIRLKKLKDEAAKAQDQVRNREIERQQVIKEAELKQAQIRKKQKENSVKRQRQAALEAERLEKDSKQRESKNEQRLAILRTQAEKMRQSLSQSMTESMTIESAVFELKRIKEQREEIFQNFSIEIKRQTQDLNRFYEKKIAPITDISPWDKEFETKEDYEVRVNEAERKAAPFQRAKEQRISSVRHQLQTTCESLTKPLDNQIKELREKRFSVPASQVSLKFLRYNLKLQLMIGTLTLNRKTEKFFINMPAPKAREYKYKPDLFATEVLMKPTLDGPKFDQMIFHGPGYSDSYKLKPFLSISDDGRLVTFAVNEVIDINNGLKVIKSEGIYVAYANGIVRDRETGLEWVAGPDEDINWHKAKEWMQSLNLDGGGWRMPTNGDLKSLCKKVSGPRKITPLLNTTGCSVWSAETDTSRGGGDGFFAYTLSLSHCNLPSHFTGGGFCTRVFAVRSQKEPNSKRLEVASLPHKSLHSQSTSAYNIVQRDGIYVAYANGIVRDTYTGLEWKVGPDRDTTWDDARSWVQSLGGGWRMPTGRELDRLCKRGIGPRNMTPLLKTTGWWVWSGKSKNLAFAKDFYLNFGSKYRPWIKPDDSKDVRAFAVR